MFVFILFAKEREQKQRDREMPCVHWFTPNYRQKPSLAQVKAGVRKSVRVSCVPGRSSAGSQGVHSQEVAVETRAQLGADTPAWAALFPISIRMPNFRVLNFTMVPK